MTLARCNNNYLIRLFKLVQSEHLSCDYNIIDFLECECLLIKRRSFKFSFYIEASKVMIRIYISITHLLTILNHILSTTVSNTELFYRLIVRISFLVLSMTVAITN